jgi:hypothetical protein
MISWNAGTGKPISNFQAQGNVTELGAVRLVIAAAGDRVIVTEVLPTGQWAPIKFATVGGAQMCGACGVMLFRCGNADGGDWSALPGRQCFCCCARCAAHHTGRAHAQVPVINPTVPRNHPRHVVNVVSHLIDAERLFVGYIDGYIRL